MEESCSNMWLNAVQVKHEPLWEANSDSFEANGERENYASREANCEARIQPEVLPPLLVFPDKVVKIEPDLVNEKICKGKDKSMCLKEEPKWGNNVNSNGVSVTSGETGPTRHVVKGETKWESGDSNAGSEAGACTVRTVKQETEEIDSAVSSGMSEAADLYADHRVKDEPEWEACGVSAAAARAGLYAGHRVKFEVVVGPESLQPPGGSFALRAASNRATTSTCGQPAPPRAPAAPEASLLPQETLLVIHKPKHAGETHACDICNKEFKTMGKLTRHKKTHTGEKPHACKQCEKKFTRPHHLRAHERIHTGETPYSCDQCTKKFAQLGQLKTHKLTHTDAKPYSCDVCQKGFTQFGSLMTHKKLHTGEKPYTCETCKRGFARLVYLKEHIRVHSRVKAHSCDVCRKEFARQGELRRHKLIHTREKPYTCNTCKKKFTQSSHLKRHQLVHTGEKQFSCDTCRKCFTQKSTLVKHRLLHAREEPAHAEAESDDKTSQ